MPCSKQCSLKTEQRKVQKRVRASRAPATSVADIVTFKKQFRTKIHGHLSNLSADWCQSGRFQDRTGSPIFERSTSVGWSQVSMESLILAQDERWRRASYMQVERDPSSGNTGEDLAANG